MKRERNITVGEKTCFRAAQTHLTDAAQSVHRACSAPVKHPAVFPGNGSLRSHPTKEREGLFFSSVSTTLATIPAA